MSHCGRCRPSRGTRRPTCCTTSASATAARAPAFGSRLLAALLAEAARCGLRTLVTASTGDGALFLRGGFREIPVALAPRGWAAGLDPARGSRVFALTLAEG